nr:hypothetical protein [Tanacetum cinerariifolium]
MNQQREQEALLAAQREQELREQEKAAQEKEEPLQNSVFRQLIEEMCGTKEVKNIVEQACKRRTRITKCLKNFKVIYNESIIPLNKIPQIFSVNAITLDLPTEESKYSLSMRDKHLSTILEMESDEVIKSSVENLVPILNHYEILSDSNDDDTLSDNDAFEDIEYVEASLPDSELVNLEEVNDVDQEEKDIDLEDIFQIQDVILREKLLNINHLIANIESLNDNPTPDRVLNSPSSFPIPIEDTFNNHTGETSSGSTITHADISLPEYDRFTFDIEPDSGELILAVMNNIDELNEDECFDLGGGNEYWTKRSKTSPKRTKPDTRMKESEKPRAKCAFIEEKPKTSP